MSEYRRVSVSRGKTLMKLMKLFSKLWRWANAAPSFTPRVVANGVGSVLVLVAKEELILRFILAKDNEGEATQKRYPVLADLIVWKF